MLEDGVVLEVSGGGCGLPIQKVLGNTEDSSLFEVPSLLGLLPRMPLLIVDVFCFTVREIWLTVRITQERYCPVFAYLHFKILCILKFKYLLNICWALAPGLVLGIQRRIHGPSVEEPRAKVEDRFSRIRYSDESMCVN